MRWWPANSTMIRLRGEAKKAITVEQVDGPGKVGRGAIGPAEPIADQSGLDPGFRVAWLARCRTLQQGFDLLGAAELGFGLGHPEHQPRIFRLGPHGLVELGMRLVKPPLKFDRSGVVQASLGQSKLQLCVLPESSLSQILLAPQRPLDRQTGPLPPERCLDPPLKLLPLHPKCASD
jgi:hypothetical protein